MVTKHAVERARIRMGIRFEVEATLAQLWRAGRPATEDDLIRYWWMKPCEERREQVYRVVLWRHRQYLMVAAGGRLITVIARPN